MELETDGVGYGHSGDEEIEDLFHEINLYQNYKYKKVNNLMSAFEHAMFNLQQSAYRECSRAIMPDLK
jgi:hypothetical protein